MAVNGFNPKNAVAVVTGGASGIGTAFCQQLAEQGARKVVVVDLNLDRAQKVADELPEGVGVALSANCAVEMDMRRVITFAMFKFGRIDAFFANAGIPANGGPEVPNDEWDRIWKVNVMQIIYVARHLFPKWEQRKERGHLVVTASAAGLLTQVGSLPYAVTKHAAVSVAEWLRITYEDKGIFTTCLCPQAVATGMVPGAKEGMSAGGPAGGDGVKSPKEVAQMTVEAMQENKFLVLPHPEVAKYFKRKATDYDRWIKGMGRMNKAFGAIVAQSPNLSAAKL